MVENERFQGLDDQRYPVLEFDGQNQTEARVGWPKMDFFHQKTHTYAKNSVVRVLPFPAKTDLVVQASSYHIVNMILKVWCRKAPGMHCNCQCASVLQMENTLCQTLQFACIKLLVGLSLWFLDSKHLGPHIQTPTLLHSICNGVDGSCYNLILEQVKISCNSVSKTCITTN